MKHWRFQDIRTSCPVPLIFHALKSLPARPKKIKKGIFSLFQQEKSKVKKKEAS
jgi:hypothetical protein